MPLILFAAIMIPSPDVQITIPNWHSFDATNLPRSQDLKPIFRETSGVYVISKDMYKKLGRRVGDKPFIKEVSFKESVDINNPEDFDLAQVLLNIEL